MELRSKSMFLHNQPNVSLAWGYKPEGSRRGRKPKARKNVVDFGRTVEFSSPTFACDFMSQLYRLYQDGICCDVILSTADYQTPTHKVVLMASSDYFKSMFLTPDLVKDFVVLPSHINSEALKSVMSYMYTGLLYLNPENVQLMLSTAEQLRIKSAVELCHQFLSYSGMNLDAPLPLLTGETGLQLDQMNDVVIKEEITSIEEAEFESKVQASDLLPIQAIGSSFAAVHLDELAVNGTSPKRSKTSLNTEKSEKLRPVGRPSNQMNMLGYRKTNSDSAVRVPKDLSRILLRKKIPTAGRGRYCRRGKRGPYKKRNRETVKESPVRQVFALGRKLLASGTKYKCNICGVGFKKYSGLIVHMKFIHRVLQLSLAVRTSKKLLQSGVILRVRRSMPCESCFLPQGEGRDNQKLSCSLCHRTFRLRARLLAHLLKCRAVKRPVMSSGQKEASIASRVKRNRLVRAQVHKCRFCRRPFAHQSTLATHCLMKHKRLKREPYTEDEAPRVRRPRTTLTCKEIDCGVTSSCIAEFKKHMVTRHPNVTYSCPDCRFSCQVERLFHRHRNQRHGKKQVCDLCGKTCPKLSLLKQHMYIHHKVKDPTLMLYQCAFEGCTYECCSKHRLADHCSRHNLGKSLKCEECGKAFKHNLGLEKHVNTIHHGIRPFICDQCGMAFGTEGELKTHVTRHSKSKPYACSHCNYRTRAKVNLQYHLFSRHKIETGLKEQKLIIMKCDQCDFSTSRKGRLEDHMKKHQNIRDIPCKECGKLFITKKNLYGHTVTVHRPKTFHCTYCNYSSALLSAFKDHVRIMHTHRHEKRYECPICRFRSATSGNCRKHIQRTHKEFQVNPKYVGAPRQSDAFRAEKEALLAASQATEETLNLSCKELPMPTGIDNCTMSS